MDRRLDFHKVLVGVLGSTNVYFQPPSGRQMRYPCIVYNRSNIDTKHANNSLYKHTVGYTVTSIDANPDSKVPEELLKLPLSRYDRGFTADNLNHVVFTIYF